MTLDDRDLTEIQAAFKVELGEHCQTLTRVFLALEKEPEPDERIELLNEAFRAAHSLKGAARAVSFGPVELVAHGLEDALGSVRQGDRDLSPALFDELYAAADTLASAFNSDGSPALAEADARRLHGRLEAALANSGRGPTPPVQNGHTALPAAPPAPAPVAVAAPPAREVASALRESRALADRSGAGETVRLPAARLDALLEQLGELVVPRLEIAEGLATLDALRGQIDAWQREWHKTRALVRRLEREGLPTHARPLVRFLEQNETHLATLSSEFGALQTRLLGPTTQLRTLTESLQLDVKQVRLLPFGTLAAGLERAVRDLTRTMGKEARLILVGGDTEVDRRVIEGIKDALLHLLRNALDHGIEPPAERERRGKPRIGSLVVTAAQRGATIVIEVEDDGTGVDPAAIRRSAVARGLASETEVEAMSDTDALALMFLPGLSTRDTVSEVSGRGIGLDVVAHAAEELGGRVEVDGRPGQGTRFVITLPLTVATTRAVLVTAADAPYALPTNAVERIIRPERLGSLAGRPVLEYESQALPVATLAALIDPRGSHPAPDLDRPGVVAILALGAQRAALAVDQVIGEEEIVVKPLGYPLLRVRYVAGATILGSGRVVPILNVRDLVRGTARSDATVARLRPAEPVRRRRRILIADDSLTTRTLECYILEAAGYDVGVAGDGAEAWTRLQEEEFDLLVSDVEMPALDGVGLTVRLRQDAKLRDLPIILVTMRDSTEDRERGLQAGADAYIVKSSFDQDHLLRTVEELV